MSPDEMNPYAAPSGGPASDTGPYQRYDQVPWYRRSSFNSLFVVLGLCCSPFIIWVCVIVLTGDVYYDKVDKDGRLKRWSSTNKIVAVIIMVIQVSATLYQLARPGLMKPGQP
jgi:fumarate reductase subunit C